MKTLNLMTHAGAQMVTREALDRVTTPGATETWHPIPHRSLFDGVAATLERSGLRIVQDVHALGREDNRYFSLMQVANGSNPDDYGLIVGLRNSHDKSFPAGLVVGSGVFVCDNLAFSGEIVIGRKHTKNIERDLPQLIDAAVGKLGDLRRTQDTRIVAYKGAELADAQVHDFLVRSLDARVIAPRRLPEVLAEYRKPRHPEFAKGRTAWRLFNAYTEVMKGTSVFERPRVTQALHGMLDAEVGIALSN